MTPLTPRLMALVCVTRGFGFVVIDERGTPIEWYVKEINEPPEQKNARCVYEAHKLIEDYRPDVLVLEDPRAPGARKRKRTTMLFEALKELAIDSGVGVAAYGPRDVRAVFALKPSANKDALAAAVAERVPALKRRLPKPRRLWQSEHYAISMFVAFALGFTHLRRGQRQ